MSDLAADAVVLGIDLGTTSVRCIAFDRDLGRLAAAQRECLPRHLTGGRVEQPAEEWWDGLVEVVRRVVAQLPRPDDVVALSLSTQGISVVPVDADGVSLGPSLSWMDTRASEELRALEERLDSLVARTGLPAKEFYTLPKVEWLRAQSDELRDAHFRLPLDFLNQRLTGHAVTDPTIAGGTMLLRLAARDWDIDTMATLGLDPAQLPRIAEPGSAVGTLTAATASALGLGTHVVVGLGGQDQKLAALAAGLGHDRATLSLGTAAAVSLLVDTPDVLPGVPTFPGLTPGTWIREGSMLTAGAAYRWFQQTMAGGAPFEELNDAAQRALERRGREGTPATVVFDPHLDGDPPAGAFHGLGLGTRSDDLALAVVEGIMREIAVVAAGMGPIPADVTFFGGGAQSSLWGQLAADAFGATVLSLTDHEMAARGAAILAIAAVTGAPVPTVASEHVATVARRHEPGTARSA